MLLSDIMAKREYDILSERASKSDRAVREITEPSCPVRTAFQRDRDRILHSKAFRRLKYKTQVFLNPEADHYRTRLTHTLEVQQIARTIARSLRLNEDLTEAIALGHDLGHTPFGHCGEEVLNRIHRGGFEHNVHSYRMVTFLEEHKGMRGLNLTEEVKDGILNHSGKNIPITLEGQVVRFSDKIAYLNHDFDDSIRAGILTESDLPPELIEILGSSHGERVNNMILNLIENSMDKDVIAFSSDFEKAFWELRTFMFKHVYLNDEAKGEEKKAQKIVELLYYHFMEHPEQIPTHYHDASQGNLADAVMYYVAGMTDRYAVSIFKDIFIPNFWF